MEGPKKLLLTPSKHLRRASHSFTPLTKSIHKTQPHDTSSKQVQRLRQTVFRLNMEIAACRGAKQKLEKSVMDYGGMEQYYLNQMEDKRMRGEFLEGRIAGLLGELVTHGGMELPQIEQGCGGCGQKEEEIVGLAEQINIKNKLIMGVEQSYREAIRKITDRLQEVKNNINSLSKENKENMLMKLKTIEQLPIPLQSQNHSQILLTPQKHSPFKKSKVVLKRVTPLSSADTSMFHDNK